ncbi:MAG: GNAT family N-acetyltransferase [bacterium]
MGDGCPSWSTPFCWGWSGRGPWAPAPAGCLATSCAGAGRSSSGRRRCTKHDSHGEFIFDWGWAEAAQRAGLPYYPSWWRPPVLARGGPRLLRAPGRGDDVRRALVQGSRGLARRLGHTGIHWLFVTPDEADLLADEGSPSATHQFHWHNEGYADFEAFLARFRSDRRNQIRRERRGVIEAGVELRVVEGDALTADDEALAWACYTSTVDKFAWGRRYLNRAFFSHLFKHFRHRIFFVRADLGGRGVASAFNIQKGADLYGRYWGCLEDIRYLHFEVCSYAGIEAAIARGLHRFEAGAGGGGHKFGRGVLPRRIYSAHEIYLPPLDRAVREYLARERAGLEAELASVEGAVLKAPTGIDPAR